MSTQGARMPEGDNRSMLDHALAYAARGWHIFPCQAGGKTPLTMRGCREATNDPEAIRRWWGRWPNANIGLACGQASGVSVVDVDVDEAKSENGHDTLDALAAINGQLPPTLTTITPRGGAHYIYQADPPPANKNDYREGIDIRGDGYYVILPPSLHPNGGRYVFIDDAAPLAGYPQWLRPELDKPKAEPPAPIAPRFDVRQDEQLTRASAYLATMAPAIEGAGGHNALFAAATAMVHGFELSDADALALLWNEYNPRCSPPWDRGDRKQSRDFERKVAEARRKAHDNPRGWLLHAEYSPAGAGSTEHGAEQAARIMAGSQREERPSPIARPTNAPPALLELARKAPGLLGSFVRWANETATREQPEFALAQALPLFGVLLGRKVQSFTGLATNVYSVAVGRTGDGKDHPLRLVDELAMQAGIGPMIEGEPASDAGIIAAIEANPALLFQLDEYGHKLAAAKSKNAAGYQLAIVSALMELFSAAKGTFRGKAYANRMERRKVEVYRPCVGLFGTTTHQQLFATIERSDIATGFVPRLNVFLRDKSRPQPSPRFGAPSLKPPAELVGYAQAWASHQPARRGEGNIAAISGPIEPTIIQPDGSARRSLEAFGQAIEADRRQMKDGPEDSLWSRAAEHAIKFATIAACSFDQPSLTALPQVNHDCAEWSIALARRLAVDMLAAVDDQLADNAIEQQYKRVVQILRDAGKRGMTKSELTRKTQWLDSRQRTSLISNMLEAGDAQIALDEAGGRQATRFFIMLN